MFFGDAFAQGPIQSTFLGAITNIKYLWLVVFLTMVVVVWWMYKNILHHGRERIQRPVVPDPVSARHRAPTRPEDFENLVCRVTSFPVEEYCHVDDLAALSVKELRSRLQHRNGRENRPGRRPL
jgi:hypothetical protein